MVLGRIIVASVLLVVAMSCSSNPMGPSGAFAVGNQYAATWTPDARTGQSAGTNWEAGGSRGSGTLTIATVDSSRISGSFSFQVTPGPGSPGTGTKSVQGNFNLSFAENRIC